MTRNGLQWISCALTAGMLLTGCGASQTAAEPETVDLTEAVTDTEGAQQEAETESMSAQQEAETESPSALQEDETETAAASVQETPQETDGETQPPEEIPTQEEAQELTYQELSNLEFYYGSGAGAWCTLLYVEADGSFSGNFHDSDMGVTGDGYPGGTLYYCDFTGAFGDLKKENAYTYSTTIQALTCANPVGEEEIIDEVKYVYSEAYGLDEAETLYFYTPDAPIDALPQDYLDWVRWQVVESEDGTLHTYGLYNAAAQKGFSGYEKFSERELLEQRLSDVEAQTQSLEELLHGGLQSQGDMNLTSYEIYQAWDGLLNEIWGYLKATLDEDAMRALTEEERAWISSKEQAVQEAGEEMAGGTMQPLLENDKAGELTKARVYELMELVRNT